MTVKTKDTTESSMNMDSMKKELENMSPIVYNKEELDCMRETKKRLEQDGVEVTNLRFLAYTCIVNKNRVDDAVKKYKKFLEVIAECGVTHIESGDCLWEDPHMAEYLRDHYQPCGLDHEGRSIMWIRGSPTEESREKTAVRAGMVYLVAIHGDARTLREGLTFVIDTSKSEKVARIGNEKRLQKMNQAYPLRPQVILIAGASASYRIVLNGLIKFASLFLKQKILQRIQFVTIEQAISKIPRASAPKYVGGEGGGVEDIVEWAKTRYYAMSVPEL